MSKQKSAKAPNTPEVFFRVLGENVAVLPDEKLKETDRGILLPEKNKEPYLRGTVVAVGNGYIINDGATIPLGVKPGERIIYPADTGYMVKEDGVDYVVIREKMIVMVLH